MITTQANLHNAMDTSLNVTWGMAKMDGWMERERERERELSFLKARSFSFRRPFPFYSSSK